MRPNVVDIVSIRLVENIHIVESRQRGNLKGLKNTALQIDQ